LLGFFILGRFAFFERLEIVVRFFPVNARERFHKCLQEVGLVESFKSDILKTDIQRDAAR